MSELKVYHCNEWHNEYTEFYMKSEADKVIAELKRALWLKRADDAKHLVIAYENYDYLDFQQMTIKQEKARPWVTCKLRTTEEWVKIWKNVERKCLAKAEEYK